MADSFRHGGQHPITTPTEAVRLVDEVRATRLPTDPLTPDEIRTVLRECVTVVAPGETLIIRVLATWTPVQVQQYQRAVTQALESWGNPFKAIVVPAEGLGVVQAPSLPERVRSLATRDRTHG